MKARARAGGGRFGRQEGEDGRRLLFNFILSTYELCSQPELSNLLSTSSDFALEVNLVGSFSFHFFVFHVRGYVGVFVIRGT